MIEGERIKMQENNKCIANDSEKNHVDNVNKGLQIVRDALHIAHQLNVVTVQNAKLFQALESEDRNDMLDILKRYLNKYRDFINNTTIITNCSVIDVPIDFYDNKSVQFIKEQLLFVKFIIYLQKSFEIGIDKKSEKEIKRIFFSE